jgi:hypothetical protein
MLERTFWENLVSEIVFLRASTILNQEQATVEFLF